MKKLDIVNKASRALNKVGFQLKKHSPEIMVVAGVVGVVGSTVLACKATTKVQAILDDAKEQVEAIHNVVEKNEEYTQEDANKALAITYTKTGLELAKLYAPAVILGAVSITSIIASHGILKKRNIAVGAAYAAVDKGFKEYRSRVIERFGKELDRELKYNIKTKEIEEIVVNEDGTESTVTKTIEVMDPNHYSPYSIIFDDGNLGWDKDAEMNKFFLVQQQNYANDLLKAKGHLFLNEVYDMLGAKRTKAGQQVGWIYDEECPIGDNYVDFGIFDIHNPKARDFVNGYEKTIVLDFNVDGVILDLI